MTTHKKHIEMMLKTIAAQIIELSNRDQALRDSLLKKGILEQGYNKDMAALHNDNAAILEDIMSKIGYPTIEKVGKEASEAAWMIIQHAIERPKFMKQSALLLQDICDKDHSYTIYWAYLTDRIAMFEGTPQKYGTQYDWDLNGHMNPILYDDLDHVNERRRRLALPSLEAQTKIIQKRTAQENQEPPKDLIKRQQEMSQWRKSVGWTK